MYTSRTWRAFYTEWKAFDGDPPGYAARSPASEPWISADLIHRLLSKEKALLDQAATKEEMWVAEQLAEKVRTGYPADGRVLSAVRHPYTAKVASTRSSPHRRAKQGPHTPGIAHTSPSPWQSETQLTAQGDEVPILGGGVRGRRAAQHLHAAREGGDRCRCHKGKADTESSGPYHGEQGSVGPDPSGDEPPAGGFSAPHGAHESQESTAIGIKANVQCFWRFILPRLFFRHGFIEDFYNGSIAK